MDLDRLDSIGLQPLKDLLQRFGGWPVIDDSWTEENFKWQVSNFGFDVFYTHAHKLSLFDYNYRFLDIIPFIYI